MRTKTLICNFKEEWVKDKGKRLMKFTGIFIFFFLAILIVPGFLQCQGPPKAPAVGDQNHLKDKISKRWDDDAATYDSYHGHGVQSQEEAAAWRGLFARLLPGKGLKVLDVGCGTGEMTLLLAQLGYEVYGLDISKKMLAKAEEKAKKRAGSNGGRPIQFQWGDAEDPPYPNDFFDAVICRHVLWTLPSPQKALNSWARIVKENGKVIVIDALWDDGSLETRIRRTVGKWLRSVMERKDSAGDHYSAEILALLPHAHGVPLDKAKTYLQQAGLQDLQEVHLTSLRDIQKKYMPFWYRLTYNYNYYAVCGQKRSPK